MVMDYFITSSVYSTVTRNVRVSFVHRSQFTSKVFLKSG